MSFLLLFSILLCACMKICSVDPDNLQDLCPAAALASNYNIFTDGLPCKNPTTITASDFKSSKLTQRGNTRNLYASATTIITAVDFPGLNTQGLSIARTDLEVDGLVIQQMHTRATEIFFVIAGVVMAGFIDNKNQLFQKVLKEGDVFVIPHGLVHFCLNVGDEPSTIYSVLNSQNPGLTTFGDAMSEPAQYDPNLMNVLLRKTESLSASHVNGTQYSSLFGF